MKPCWYLFLATQLTKGMAKITMALQISSTSASRNFWTASQDIYYPNLHHLIILLPPDSSLLAPPS